MNDEAVLTREDKIKEVVKHRAPLLFEKCKRDNLFWLKNYVFTYDEHDKITPVKRFPNKEYVETLVKAFNSEKILHVMKSRQMLISWLFMSLLLHEANFYDYRLVAVFSKKEDDAQNLVERAKFVYTNQPAWIKSRCPLERQMKDMPFGNLFFKNGSKIKGFAQGKDQIRSYVPSIAFIDEAAFQDKLEETYNACVPCSEKIITVSSAGKGYFASLCGEVA